ncbi:MAG: (d)CMP kinase [Clostridia bacterium]
MSFIVAIDGPAGSGKSTLTKLVAKSMNLVNIDTGAMYRCVALEMLNKGITLEEKDKIIGLLENLEITFKNKPEGQLVFLNGKDVTKEIRNKKVTNVVSQVSSITEVRLKLVEMQRELAKGKDVIMEGRDIGSYVFPNADVKIYIDATLEERARRRVEENKQKGIEMSYEEVLENIKMRDENDKHKEIGSLVQTPDAIYVDTTEPDIKKNQEKLEAIILAKRKEIEEEEKTKKKLEHNKRRTEDTRGKLICRKIIKGFLHFLYIVVYRIKVVGQENIPETGAYIVCGNHVHALDAPAVVLCIKRHLNFIAKEELYQNPYIAWLGRLFNVIPIKRGKQDIEAMKRSLKVLSSGEMLGLFPEGTRNGMGKGEDVKNGAAFMAARTGKPVIPIGIQGDFKPFHKIILNIGKPLDFSDYQSKTPDKETLNHISKAIMDNIVMLTNEKV